MKRAEQPKRRSGATRVVLLALVSILVGTFAALGQDWPRWRGAAGDGQLAGFTAPSAWPAKLDKVWQLEVGEGHASPVVSGAFAYAFARQGEDAKVVVLPQTSMAARAHQMAATQSYASQPATPAQAAWDRIRRTGVY